MYKKIWIGHVVRALQRKYRAKAYSKKETPWRTLLFTLLSARSRDEQTELAYRKLLAVYRTPRALAKANSKDVESYLKQIGLYRNKAKNSVALARELVDRHSGRVPQDIDTLIALPGVGRKTANCTLIYAFGKSAMCVDTHVHRVTNRLGLVKTKTPEQTEFALRKTVPQRFWLHLNRVMVQFGRTICLPGRPKCWQCPVRTWCRYPHKTLRPN